MTPEQIYNLALKMVSCNLTLESNCTLLELARLRGTIDIDLKVILDTAERVAKQLNDTVKEYREHMV